MATRNALLDGHTRNDKLSGKIPSASRSASSSSFLRGGVLMICVRLLIAALIAASFHVHSVSSSPNANHTSTEEEPIVTIAQGKLRGYKTQAGPYLFNNIPFAQPPVGKLRWLPPQLPPPSWTGVRDAQALSNMCVQHADTELAINGLIMGSEDCLYLNVYTKRITVVTDSNNCTITSILNPEKRLSPVIVFVHGGSSVSGYSSIPFYDQQNVVANRDVVAVTVNYRLTVFGYLALDVLSSHQYNVTGVRTSGNYGLQDNIAALKWVKANIAAFGGDSDRVTLYGQSSGATNAVCLYMSPLARGLFNAVLSLSASPRLTGDLAHASVQNAPFLSLSGCDNKNSEQETLDCIYALSPQEANSATPPSWGVSYGFGLANFSALDPAIIIVDKYVVPAAINTALSEGFGAEVVLEYGHMAQEIDLAPDEQPVDYNQSGFAQWLTEVTPSYGWNTTQTEKIIELYPISDYENDSQLTYESFVNDWVVCGGLFNLNQTSTSEPRHTSQIFHHVIHYHPSVPSEYFGSQFGWFARHAGHLWDLLTFLETNLNTTVITELDRQHTQLLRTLWVDELATKLTIDKALWPEFNVAELSGRPNSTWTLELLQEDEHLNPKFKATPNYHGDKCMLLFEYGFFVAAWTN